MSIESGRPAYRRLAMIGGVALAGASVSAYLIGLYLHQGPPPGCEEYVYCHSERDRWSAETREWFLGASLLGLLVAWWTFAWRPISNHPRLRRVGSVIALVGCVPLAGLLAVLAYLVAGATCEPDAILCLSGAGDALAFGIPATVAAVLSLLLAVTLACRDDRRAARLSGTLALTVISSVLVLATAGFVLVALHI
ncbi:MULTISPECIES: hypothetical protein [unclassified Nocardioides]|uniref:hypothetical protein n=1 Tax=unclassified Nocardioides TaxID=2615069 RepID=UPI0010549436|nr:MULTISPECIES: hypothetical protein [unclassified Nocardioides]